MLRRTIFHTRPRALTGLLAAAGTAIGVIVAAFGLPYGRLNYTAFAGLYHGGVPVVSMQFEVDCDAATVTASLNYVTGGA